MSLIEYLTLSFVGGILLGFVQSAARVPLMLSLMNAAMYGAMCFVLYAKLKG